MPTVPGLLFEGLAEGLALRSIEREPATPVQLAERFERLLGASPQTTRLSRLIERLSEADRIRPDDGGREPVFRLTQDGARRLHDYRTLPDPGKAALRDLFLLDGDASEAARPPPVDTEAPSGTAPRAPSQPAGPEPTLDAGRGGRPGWVSEVLEQVPVGAEVQARYARVHLDHEPSARRWTLTVEQHDPGTYEGAEVCPLTFLYAAATRLLYRPPRPVDAPATAGTP